ncbi:hypothetical protein COO60DRAFT_1538289, partial [Scenedesmus sp. NREL 46B-D3]
MTAVSQAHLGLLVTAAAPQTHAKRCAGSAGATRSGCPAHHEQLPGRHQQHACRQHKQQTQCKTTLVQNRTPRKQPKADTAWPLQASGAQAST